MFAINPQLDPSDLKSSFETQRSIEVFDFLVAEDADKLFQFFTQDMPDHWWSTSTLIKGGENSGYNEGVTHTRRFTQNLATCNELTIKANQSFHEKNFCYSFDRTLDDHHKGCPCLECHFREFTKSEVFLNFVNTVTKMDIKESKELFSSRFRAGQFLSPHHDHNKGKIGFVYSLSKHWKPEWGGNLFFMEEDYSTVKKVVQPVFNRLVMFDIATRNGVPHFVSHVIPGTKHGRISITGWFL
jgi:Rps23 Pro-64 3,4-dihydroxylase Tpa1-like proline 4-hydroxylase